MHPIKWMIVGALALTATTTTYAQSSNGTAWAWQSGNAHSDGKITLPTSAAVITQNPTAGSAAVNQSVATQPPLVVVSGGSINVSDAIGLSDGNVYAYDTNYKAWIFIPSATFASRYSYTSSSAIASNVWVPTTVPNRTTSYTYTLACDGSNKGSGSATGTNWNGINGSDPYSVSTNGISATVTYVYSFSGGPYLNTAYVGYNNSFQVTINYGSSSISDSQTLIYTWGLGCYSNPGATKSDSGTLPDSYFTPLSAIFAKIGNDPAGGSNALALLCENVRGQRCVIASKDGATQIALASNVANMIYSVSSANAFAALVPGRIYMKDASNNLYAVNADGSMSNLGNIGAAKPVTYYVGMKTK